MTGINLGINIAAESSVVLTRGKHTATWLGHSQFPHEALHSASEALEGDVVDCIHICSDEHDPEKLLHSRNCEIAWMAERVPHHQTNRLSREFTQHDALAWTGRYFSDTEHYLVVNDHGSYGEVISLYRSNGGLDLEYRLHGLNNSIGMLERATLEHIGFESSPLYSVAQTYEGNLGGLFKPMVDKAVTYMVTQRNKLNQKFDPMFNLLAMGNARQNVCKLWREIERFGYRKGVSLSSCGYGVCVAAIAQATIETLISVLLQRHNVTDVTCVGNVFANMGVRQRVKAATIPTNGGAIGMIYYNDRSIKT